MATTVDSQTTTGTAQYTFSFPYLEQSDVVITVNGAAQTLGTAYVFTATNQVTFQPGFIPIAGLPIIFTRQTSAETLPVDFSSGTSLRAVDLNSNFKQNLYIAQETQNLTVEASSGALADGSITTAKIATGAVTSAKIATGTIVNDDVNASAAIVYSKLALGNSIINTDISSSTTITGTKIQQGNTTTRGTVQLYDAADSTSTTLAVTANALKTVKDTLTTSINSIDATQPFTRRSINANDSIAVSEHVTVTAAGVTITLPTGTDGDTVRISVGSFTDTVVTSPQNIMASAADLTINIALKTITLMYDNNQDGGLSVVGWRII